MLVGGNDFGFQLDALGYQALNFDWIALEDLRAFLFEAQEKIEIPNDAAFEGLVESSAISPVRKRVQDFRVNENNARMVISSQQILPCPKIHSGFAADGCIHLGQDRGWNLHQVDAPHVEGG